MATDEEDLDEGTDGAQNERAQYDAWGVLVRTSNVRAGHIANGVMQLLRLLPDAAPSWANLTDEPRPSRAYVTAVRQALNARFGGASGWQLRHEARALCVTRSKDGPLRLDAPPSKADPIFLREGRTRLKERFAAESGFPITAAMQDMLSAALNADGRVMASGGSDPTTPGLSFAGFTETHTLRGMHAATFLGMLCASDEGRQALARFYDLARDVSDPHSSLASVLGLSVPVPLASALSPSSLANTFPVPTSAGWSAWSKTVGYLTRNLLAWSRHGASKADTLVATIDLAALFHCLRMLRWTGDGGHARLLLCVSPPERGASMMQAVSRAQESLQRASAALDMTADKVGLISRGKQSKKGTRYDPSVHALHLGAAGGWLFPLDARGGAKRYVRPGPRQLVTLTHALLEPGSVVSWPEFARRAEEIGLVIGGPNEHQTERRLGIGGVASTLREVGFVNREHLIALGLARRESDNVVLVDGGLQ